VPFAERSSRYDVAPPVGAFHVNAMLVAVGIPVKFVGGLQSVVIGDDVAAVAELTPAEFTAKTL